MSTTDELSWTDAREAAPDPLGAFTRQLDAMVGSISDPAMRAWNVAEALRQLLTHEDFLPAQFCEPGSDAPRAHTVHVGLRGEYSVVSFVWQPGQSTCIHDHVCWCVVGVVQGLEQEVRYALKRDESGAAWLEPTEPHVVTAGHTSVLIPPEEDIHAVKNIGTGTAISLHVYGANIAELGTSINHRFDLPIREVHAHEPGQAAQWRRS